MDDKLGLGLTVFVSVEVADHGAHSLARFTEKIAAMREVVEFYRLGGDAYHRLAETTRLKSVTSRIALVTIKSETAFTVIYNG